MRESILRVTGRQPMSRPIQRRTYSVPGPNALWHLDGNHKLVKWRLVIHGCIDGFSRLITFLSCSNNNKSETVLDYFTKATQEFGVPSRVRTDYGGENVRVWHFMEEARGRDRGSYIAGSSVHNTRIECLWKDVVSSVVSTYKDVFGDLEQIGTLNSENEADLFSLHYVFIPKINQDLQSFRAAWNSHSLSTENHRSPLQLYHACSLGSSLFDEEIDPLVYGCDENSETSDDEDFESITVPETFIPFSARSIRDIRSRIIHSVIVMIMDDNYIWTQCP